MNFFEHQDEARRRTRLLIGLFVAAIFVIVVAVYVLAIGTEIWTVTEFDTGMSDVEFPPLWQPELFTWVTTMVFVVMGYAAFSKRRELDSGGAAVAVALGGRQVLPNTAQPGERKLMNIVEEMAIASGTPVPFVFILDGEPNINAFAAGYTYEDAAIAVTRGCMEQLSRDELQGVIAHEFSHLHNGDSRLNLQLITALHGLLGLSGVGRFLIRFGTGGRRSQGGWPLAVVGIALWLLGLVGVGFGYLIQAAVSRQREFLADASAVQFTRNKDGISGALRKIGDLTQGAAIEHHGAAEMSHLFFGDCRPDRFFAGIMATHPPLPIRIGRIEQLAPEVVAGDTPITSALAPVGLDLAHGTILAAAPGGSGAAKSDAGEVAAAPAQRHVSPQAAVDSIGQPTSAHVEHSTQLIDALPIAAVAAARETFSAIAMVLVLLLDSRDEERAHQLETLRGIITAGLVDEVRRLEPMLAATPARLRLPLVELAVPALRQLRGAQRQKFVAAVEAMIDADRSRSIFEHALSHILLRRLVRDAGGHGHHDVKHRTVQSIAGNVTTILSALAWAGQQEPVAAAAAFAAAAHRVPGAFATQVRLEPREHCEFDAVDRALTRLEHATPGLRHHVVDACAHCVLFDEKVTDEEADLLRALAEVLGCPMPPFLPS